MRREKTFRRFRVNLIINFGLACFPLICFAANLQLEETLTGIIISTETVSGTIDFGVIDALGVNPGNTAFVDGIYLIDSADRLVTNTIGVKGALYIIGKNTSGGAIEVKALGLAGGTTGELSVTSVGGGLDMYLSKSDKLWNIGTSLNDSQHLHIPNNGAQMLLMGAGGLIDSHPLGETNPSLRLDLAAKVSVNEPKGIKTKTITFTLITN